VPLRKPRRVVELRDQSHKNREIFPEVIRKSGRFSCVIFSVFQIMPCAKGSTESIPFLWQPGATYSPCKMRYCQAAELFHKVLGFSGAPVFVLVCRMTESSRPRKARFKVGDRVRAIGASVRPRTDNTGQVTEVLGSAENMVYRYRVTFADGSSEAFFGFELEAATKS